MRITGGEYRGRKIYSGKLKDVRPATDRVRETIFSILPQYIHFPGATVVDLYAGTGSLGFECLSRGAQFVVFVDISKEAVRAINKTAEALECLDRCEVIRISVDRFLKNPSIQARLIFADPPYAMEHLVNLPSQIAQSEIKKDDAILLIEHNKQTTFPENSIYSIIRQKIFGNSIVSFFRLYSSATNNRVRL